MYKSVLINLIIFSAFAVSCSTSPGSGETSTEWELIGLHEQEDETSIRSISERDGVLYAGGTHSVFISEGPNFSSWRELGLQVEEANYLTLALGNDQKIIAAAFCSSSSLDEQNRVLFESPDNGETWEEISPNVEGSSFQSLRVLEPLSNDLGVLFGYSDSVGVSRSTDGGRNWNIVYDDGEASLFLAVSENNSDHIWTGGTEKRSPWPYLAVSRDDGETWTQLSKQVAPDFRGSIFTVVTSPDDPDVVLVGLSSSGPAIRKTKDGGQTWVTVLEDYNVRTMHRSRESPSRIYASGIDSTSKPSIVVSDDYGDSWTIHVHEEGLSNVSVYDMTVAEIDGREVVFLGTNRGIYSFQLE